MTTTGSTPFDLASTYVKLDDDGSGRAVPVDESFWAEIDSRPEFSHGRLVMTFRFERDWPTWEIHPAGAEIVTLLSGAMDLVLALPGGDATVPLRDRATCLVPAGTWHTARVLEPSEALFVTPCAGTRNAASPER